VAAVTLTAGRRPWDAAHLALSPLLVTAGLISYELLAVTLSAIALLALGRGRPLIGGLLLGLAVSSAPQVAVIGVVTAVLAGRYRLAAARVAASCAVFAGSALGCWLIVRILLLRGVTGELVTAGKGWFESVPGYGSVWLGPQLLEASRPGPLTSVGGRALLAVFGWIFGIGPLGGTATSVLSLLLLVVLGAMILRATLIMDPPDGPPVDEMPFGEHPMDRAPMDHLSADAAPAGPSLGRLVTDKVAPLSLALLSAVLLSAKSLPVQASLLLLPLIALSGLRWRDHLIWVATELVYFVGIWLYIAGETTPNRGLPAAFYLPLLAARLAGIAWIGAQGVMVYRSRANVTTSGPDPAVDNTDPAVDNTDPAVDKTVPERAPVDRFLSR
jgi:hypothetical protein